MIPQSELSLRGSNGVAFNEGRRILGQIRRAAGEQLLLLFTAFGDTYPSIYYTKHSVASSNTVIPPIALPLIVYCITDNKKFWKSYFYNENEALSLQSSLWPPPGPQDGLGRGRLRLKGVKGRFW